MSLIPGRRKGVREKILAMLSVGVRAETHVRRNECAVWGSSKKATLGLDSTGHLNGAWQCGAMKMARSCKEGVAVKLSKAALNLLIKK